MKREALSIPIATVLSVVMLIGCGSGRWSGKKSNTTALQGAGCKEQGPVAVKRFRETVGAEKWEKLGARIAELNNDIINRGIKQSFGTEVFTGYEWVIYPDWDLYFEDIYFSYYGVRKFCRTHIEAFLARQQPSGFISRALPIAEYRMRQHFKPFMAQIILLGCRQSGDYEWLKQEGSIYWAQYPVPGYQTRSDHPWYKPTLYEQLKKYLDYWFWYSDFDRNGLCTWDSADHSGMDNQDTRAGIMFAMVAEGVDLNCYLVRELETMAVIAEKLGYEDDKKEFLRHAAKLKELINKVLWDEKDGFYYDRYERKGKLIKVKSASGLLPLWAGVASERQAKRLIEEHLLNEKEFWLKYPLSTYSKSEPDYHQQPEREGICNWRGPVWLPINYMVFHSLLRYGYRDAARELAYKTFDMVLSEKTTREFYNAETGQGFGMNPFWGFSSLGYIMPLEFELGYDPSDIENENIMPIVTELMGTSIAIK